MERQAGTIIVDDTGCVLSANKAARAICGHAIPKGTPIADLACVAPCTTHVPAFAGVDGFSALHGAWSQRRFEAIACHCRRVRGNLRFDIEPLDSLVEFAEQLTERVLISDPTGCVLYVNQAIRHSLDYQNAPDVRGTSVVEHAERSGMNPDAVRNMMRVALHGGSCREPFLAIDGDLKHHYVLATATPFRYFHNICAIVWTTRSLPSYEELQDRQALLAIAYRLEAMYQHEVRNPLQTVQAALALIRTRVPAGCYADLLDIADRNLLSISEILSTDPLPNQAIRRPLPAARLSSIVDEAIHDATLRQSSCRLTFVHRPQPAEPAVVCDHAGISRVFANLFRNTAQARPDAQVTISYFQSADALTCVVEDDGPGFPPNILTRILATDDRTGGLGLVLVSAIVEASSGTVTYGTATGGGARVEIALRLADVAVSGSAPQSDPPFASKGWGSGNFASRGSMGGGGIDREVAVGKL